nr:hypothetical protein [Brevibacillus composti]
MLGKLLSFFREKDQKSAAVCFTYFFLDQFLAQKDVENTGSRRLVFGRPGGNLLLIDAVLLAQAHQHGKLFGRNIQLPQA